MAKHYLEQMDELKSQIKSLNDKVLSDNKSLIYANMEKKLEHKNDHIM